MKSEATRSHHSKELFSANTPIVRLRRLAEARKITGV